jgi:hypothetical protein
VYLTYVAMQNRREQEYQYLLYMNCTSKLLKDILGTHFLQSSHIPSIVRDPQNYLTIFFFSLIYICVKRGVITVVLVFSHHLGFHNSIHISTFFLTVKSCEIRCMGKLQSHKYYSIHSRSLIIIVQVELSFSRHRNWQVVCRN